MTIAAEKVKYATNRITLARIGARRYVSGDLASIGGNQYSMTFPYYVASIKRNGTLLDKVTSIAGNDDYTWDEDTGLITMQLAAAPSASNIVIIEYYIFVANTPTFLEYNPISPSGSLQYWEPLLTATPDLGLSVENILYGVFTIQDLNLQIINRDEHFSQYLTDNDSFNDAEVYVYTALNDVANIQLSYIGRCRTVAVTADIVSLTIKDAFSTLDKPALMGDSGTESYFKVINGAYPNGREADNNRPIPYIFGRLSYHNHFDYADNTIGSGYKIKSANEAICSDYLSIESGAGTSDNRDWVLCRVDNLKTESLGTIVRQTQVGNDMYLYLTGSSGLFVGQIIRWRVTSVDYYGRIEYLDDFTYSSNDYNVIMRIETFGSPAISTGNLMAAAAPSIIIWDASSDVWYYPYHTRDFTYTLVPTAGGNNIVTITFVNNFEATLGMGALDPDRDKVYYVVQSSESMLHGSVIERIIEASGLTADSTSISDANTDFAEYTAFQIPFIGETGYGRYADYLQRLLRSTLGYISLASDGEVEYRLLRDLPAGTSTIDQSLRLDGSMSSEYSYDDIVTEISFTNQHIGITEKLISTTDGPEATVSSSLAKYLHGIENSITIEHSLENIHNIKNTILSVYSNRLGRHSFRTATQNIDSVIGDEVTITDFGSSDIDAKITGITKGGESIEVQTVDLLGLT